MREAPILVVDDDPSIRTTVSDVLDMEGYSVVTAANGAETLRQIEQTRPLLVVLDMRMPVMDGWGFAEALAARGMKVRILVMTPADNARAWADEIGARRLCGQALRPGGPHRRRRTPGSERPAA